VVGHRRGSVEEVIDDGVTGFHSGVIDALADFVPEALALDRQKVRAQAEARFSYQAMVDAYLELYHGLIG
jgi:glycosyltransferase involved in cell wall biosynthesis